MAEVFPKYIVEDGSLIIGKCTFHKELAKDITKVVGGGWFTYNRENNSFTFSGDSYDFGKATYEQVKDCFSNGKVFDRGGYREMSKEHQFFYNTGTKIKPLN